MQDSIFTKIIKGELPSYKIYEDDNTYAFLDINPIMPGHTLVIPKKQVQFIWDLEQDDYQSLMKSVKKIGTHMRNVLPQKHIGIKVVGLDVPHTHVHLVPFDTVEEYDRVVGNLNMSDKDFKEIAKKLQIND